MVPWGTINGLFIGANVFCIILYAICIALAKRYNAGNVVGDEGVAESESAAKGKAGVEERRKGES